MAQWTDFLDMIADVHRHVRATRTPVDLAENPHAGVFGYQAKTGETWTISLEDLKHSLFDVADEKMLMDAYIMRKCVKTAFGRLHLANYILG